MCHRCVQSDETATDAARRLGGWLSLCILFAVACGCRSDRWGGGDIAHLAGELPMPGEHVVAVHDAAASEMLLADPALEGPHAVEEYVDVALANNPDVQAARQEVAARSSQVTVAASLPDPNLTTVAQPAPVQTAAGEFQFILNANQKFPWFGKLDARGAVAQAEVNSARAELVAATLATATGVKKVYYELFYVQRAIEVTEEERALLLQLRTVADTRYQTGQASLQDVLRADLEISGIDNSLIDLRQRKVTEQARLARLLNVSPQTRMEAEAELSPAALGEDLTTLQGQAVAARPELHEALARVTRDRRAVELARLDYRPDVTLGFAWIDVADAGLAPSSNGQDAVLLTAGVNLPIYRRRLDAQVRSAEAGAMASARRYDSLRAATLEEVTELVSTAASREEMLRLFDTDILPKARQTLEVSIEAYNVGDVDFLQLLDNWRQVLRYDLGRHRLEADLRQALAGLEQAVGGWSFTQVAEPQAEEVAAPAASAADAAGDRDETATEAVDSSPAGKVPSEPLPVPAADAGNPLRRSG
jgi:cobalt-zinc-cadmium efflux system outer membrane protein